MKVSFGILNTFAKRNVLLNMVEETATVLREVPVYAGFATVDALTKFGGVIDEEPYNDSEFDPDDYDNYFESYNEYYEACHRIGYIPAGTTVTIEGNADTGLVLVRNDVHIFAPTSEYDDVYEVTPTKNGEIYFTYIKDHKHMPFDSAVQAIKDAGRIFGINYDIGYTTQNERITARMKATRANTTI